MTSRAFAESANLLLLAQVAEMWCCRPSDLLGRRQPAIVCRCQPAIDNRQPLSDVMALQIDIAAAVTLWRWKEQRSQVADSTQ